MKMSKVYSQEKNPRADLCVPAGLGHVANVSEFVVHLRQPSPGRAGSF